MLIYVYIYSLNFPIPNKFTLCSDWRNSTKYSKCNNSLSLSWISTNTCGIFLLLLRFFFHSSRTRKLFHFYCVNIYYSRQLVILFTLSYLINIVLFPLTLPLPLALFVYNIYSDNIAFQPTNTFRLCFVLSSFMFYIHILFGRLISVLMATF